MYEHSGTFRCLVNVATTTWKVADRRGVFVDYGQNSRDRTIASAYSIRPTPDARASAPLDWDEVASVRPERFTLTTMRKRVDEVGDLTKGMWRYKRSLIPLFSKLALEPAHPYTKALFSAALPSHPDERREEVVLAGEVPSPLNPPSGCHFHPRCPHATERCAREEPKLAQVQGRLVACHLFG